MQEVSSEQDLQDAIALKVFDGDDSALTDMLVRYGPRLERALLKRFGGELSVEDIEEIISDAVRKFWSARTRYDDKKASIRWLLYVIAKRLALDVLKLGWHKARSLELNVEKEFLEGQYVEGQHLGAATADDPPVSEETARRDKTVRDTLAEISNPLQRQILEHDAFAEDEVDAAELGRRLGGIPAGTIRVNRARAKEAFKAGMKKRGYDVL